MFYKLVFENKTLTNADIQGGINYSIDINPFEDIQFGITSSAIVSFTYYNINNDASSLVGETFTYSRRQNATDAWEQVGVFTVENVVKNDEWATFTAYDNILKLEQDAYLYLQSIIFPITLADLFDGICEHCEVNNVTYTGTNCSQSILKWDIAAAITARGLVNMLAGAAGCFVIADANGNLVMRDYVVNSTVIDNTKYAKKTESDYTTELIDLLTIQTSGTPLTYGSGMNEYAIDSNPIAAQLTQLQPLYNKLHAISYKPATLELYEDYGVKVGDIINGNFYVMKKDIDASGVVLECVGRTWRKPENNGVEAYSVDTGSIVDGAITGDKIENLAIGTAKIADATITTAKIHDAAITNAKIVDGTIGNAKIADATIEGAKIANATIGTSKIQSGAITTALIDTGAVGTAQIADASITDAKIVSMTANKISAGTIDASSITVTNLNADNITTGSLNGQRIEDGAITTTKLGDEAVTTGKIDDGAVETAKIADSAITADKIVSSAITTDKLAANSVTANKIVSNSITADKMSVSDLSAIAANIGTITGGKLQNSAQTSVVNVGAGTMMFADNANFDNATQGIRWDGSELGIKGTIYIGGKTVTELVEGKADYNEVFGVDTYSDGTHTVYKKTEEGVDIYYYTNDSGEEVIVPYSDLQKDEQGNPIVNRSLATTVENYQTSNDEVITNIQTDINNRATYTDVSQQIAAQETVLTEAISAVDSRVDGVSQQVAQAQQDAKKYDNYLQFDTSNGLQVGYTGQQSKVKITGGGVALYSAQGEKAVDIQTSLTTIPTMSTNYLYFGNFMIQYKPSTDEIICRRI